MTEADRQKIQQLENWIWILFGRTEGDAGFDVGFAPFTFASASPLIVHAFPTGARLIRAAVLIDTTFDGVAPTLKLGTPAAPELVLAAADIDASMLGQYEQDVVITNTGAPTSLELAIFSGASTQGSGVVLFEIKE